MIEILKVEKIKLKNRWNLIFCPYAKPQAAQYVFSMFIEQVWIRTPWTKAVNRFLMKVELWQSPDVQN